MIALDIIQSLVLVSCVIGCIFKYQTFLFEKQNQALLEKEQELLSASQAKSDFLANMSHEIRTPINAMLGMDEMILRECEEESINNYAKNIQSAGSTLLSLINDILDFSKIEAGRMELVSVEYSVYSLLNDSYNMVSMRAKEKNLVLRVKNNTAMPCELWGDEVRVRQVLNNLATNAVKYTESGEVVIIADYEPLDEERILLTLAVEDTGIGIKESALEQLFVSFKRIEEKRNRNIEGTGLGLTITKQLVSMMDGSIEVKSEYGKGSLFTVKIPQKVINAKPLGSFYEQYDSGNCEAQKYKEKFTAPDANILAVDDVPMNLEVIRALLKKTKIHIDFAKSGKEALELLKKKTYHLILMDHMMPEMDGVETLRHIRDLKNNEKSRIPVLALTANAIMGAEETYLSEGFQDYISKPVRGARLEEAILKYIPHDLVQYDEKMENNTRLDDEALRDFQFLDLEKGLEYSGGSIDFYLEIVAAFIDDNKVEKLEYYFQEEDWVNYELCIHSLMTNALSLGATRLSDEARQIENALRRDDYHYVKTHHESAVRHYERLNERLKNTMKGRN
ncbi:MAG: response regulator, partial [Eubacterium sp.]|nr:response regulator [Eubacterium sp.]